MAFLFVKEPITSIYFIQCGTNGPIKIGYTNKDIKERLSQLQTACPYELKLLWVTDGDQEDEQKMHESLKHENIRGEWFRPADHVFSAIDDSENEFLIKLNNDNEISIFEGFNKRIFISSPIGEMVLDLKNGSFDINPSTKNAAVVVHKWWDK